MYESEEYYRANVQPQLDDGSSIPADVYIWKDQYRCVHVWGGRVQLATGCWCLFAHSASACAGKFTAFF